VALATAPALVVASVACRVRLTVALWFAPVTVGVSVLQLRA